jgi:N-acetylglucosaminyl-diphospho-decaprenol L-rhamnosyltransferase
MSPRALAASIDVIIPAHNGWRFTERCLQRLSAQTVAHDVVVCDNGSNDRTPDRVRSAFPTAHVLELGMNLGFGRACNEGVRSTSGEAVVLLNNDVECRPDFLERLVAPFEDAEHIGSVAALLLMQGEEHIDSVGLAVDSTLAGYPRFHGRPVGEARVIRSTLVGPAGAAAAYRRSAWEDVGGLDEGVFAYGEDVDLALRLRAAGWSTAAAPGAVAVHRGSASAGRRSAWQRHQGGFSRGYFMRRYGVLRSRAALRAVTTEVLAVAGDALVFSHDLAALRGRLSGWRAAAGLPRSPRPPEDVIDHDITFLESVRLRRRVYSCM